jgi:hypothetical protein
MPRSRSKPKPQEGPTPDGRRQSLTSSPPLRRTTPLGPRATAGGPEWTTERWKLQVEAEARSRLKKIIRDVGTDR